MATTNLGMPTIPENSLQPGVAVNSALATLDAAVAGTASLTMADANYTLLPTDYQASVLVIGGTLTAGRDVVFPAAFPSMLVTNNTAQTLTLKKIGQTGVALAAGDAAHVSSGVTDVVVATASGGGGGGLSDGDYGDVTVGGSGTTMTIDNDAVTYAKMQNVSATSRVLGRRTAAAGDVEECTLSQVLDMVGSAADGDILYRSAGAWTRLAAGTDTHVLTLASGLPTWAAAGGGGSLTNWTESVNTSSPNGSVPVVQFLATNAATNVDIALTPKGGGNITRHVADSTATGGNKRGFGAVDFQRTRSAAAQVANGTDSAIMGSVNSTASGNQSTVIGSNGSTASNTNACAIGATSGTASGNNSVVMGASNTASGSSALATGSNATASGAQSFAHGANSNTRSLSNSRACGTGGTGSPQFLELPMGLQTTNATPAVLTSSGSATASTTNQYTIPTGASMLRVQIVAHHASNTDCAGWDIPVLIRNIGGTLTIVGTPPVTQAYGDAGASAWAVALTADSTLDCLTITVTGAAATTINWSARVVGPHAA